MNLFSEESLRDPFPIYDQMRSAAPVYEHPETGLWMVFDYADVKRVLTEYTTFSSRHGPNWMGFTDPPRHTKLRALVSQAFTAKSIANLETRIQRLTAELLARCDDNQIDFGRQVAEPLPMLVITEMLGIPRNDWELCKRWNHVMVDMSYTIPGGPGSREATDAFIGATADMHAYLVKLLTDRRTEPRDDLLTRLCQAELEGEKLTDVEILGFFQLLLLAGSETTTNLLNNAVICLLDNPEQFALLRSQPGLLPLALEEVLRYRSPVQWMYRKTASDTEINGTIIPAGKLMLAMIGSANRDPRQFPNADVFDIRRDPNPHIAFGNGVHFCLGAPLARLEARLALTQFLNRYSSFSYASDPPWQPRKGLHVHGPASLLLNLRRN